MRMNDKAPNQQAPAGDQAKPSDAGPPARTRPGNLFSVLLGIIAVGGACTAIYFSYQNRNADSATQGSLTELLETTVALGTQVEELEDGLAGLRDEQEAAGRALLELAAERPGSNEDWALAEIEFLLIRADHYARLERDPAAALASMAAAELRLRGLDNPSLLPLRDQLARDVAQLKALEVPDTGALALRLNNLQKQVGDLPLASKESAPGHGQADTGQAESPSAGILETLWRELQSLVVIRREQDQQQAMLYPGQEKFVYQNLRLGLETARLSLLRGDTANLHASISLVQQSLQQYFAVDDPDVAGFMDSLRPLTTIDLNPPLPDVSSSLESLRAYLRARAANTGGVFPGPGDAGA